MNSDTPAAGDFDPFAGITDEPDPGPSGTLQTLLTDVRREFTPLRKTFVQRPNTETQPRASLLADFVTKRQQRALDALLLLHALQPILPGSPLTLRTWARLLSTRTPCTSNAASTAFSVLADMNLASRTGPDRKPTITPLLEDGSGQPWSRPGLTAGDGPGYFTLPHEYWTQGFADQLTLPGKAMLLIMLAETQTTAKPAFKMPVERAPEWYGISERTAERGYGELGRAGLLAVRVTKVADARHPAGRRAEFWRALNSPFSTADRSRLQQTAKKAVRAREARATGQTAPLAPAQPTVPTGPPGAGNTPNDEKGETT